MTDEPTAGDGSTFRAESAEEPRAGIGRLLRIRDAMDTPEIHELEPPAARETFASFLVGDEPAVEVGRVEDRTIPGPDGDLPVRVYEPSEGDRWDPGPPVVVYLHGGGFVLGGLETHDDTCRVLCESADATVVAVDYRLAPEHPFPAAVEDAYAATEWADDNAASLGGDPERLVVAGDSAGGALASAVSLHARDRRRRDRSAPDLDYQVLLYPVTDHETEGVMGEDEEGYFISRPELEYYYEHYLAHPLHAYNKLAFPKHARDVSGLPPTSVVTAGFDPLRDVGVAFASRLDEAGVSVRFRNYEGMVHGFAAMLGRFEIAQGHDALAAVGDDLVDALE